MADERWAPVAGFEGTHERSSRGRVRTTAAGTSGVPVGSLLWLLLLGAVAVMAWQAHAVNTIANAVAVGLCAVPGVWLVRHLVGEVRLSWECRRYAAQDARRARPVRLALTARAPLALEAARSVARPIVIESEWVER